MNIRTKLLSPILLALLIFTVAVHFYWRPIMLNQEKEEIIECEQDVLRNLVPGLLRGLLIGDLGDVYVTLDRLIEINAGEGYQIELFNMQGKRLYPIVSLTENLSPYIIELKQVLEFEQRQLGYLVVKVNWKERYEETEGQLLSIELMVLSLFGFILLAIFTIQNLIIVRPLIAIKDASLQLARGENEIDLALQGKDEVSELARSFDHMRQSLLDTQETLIRKACEAEQANRAKSDFLSRMSHELRTPMNAILGFGQMLKLDAEDFNETQKDNIEEILEAGHHLLDLINEVLDLSRIESGKLQISMEAVPLDDVLRQCIVLVNKQLETHQLELIDNVSNKNYIVRADFTRLKQVLLNLLSNAVKYNCDNGCITLDSEITDDKHLRICVTDTGNGLTEKEISQLFMPFERLNVNDNIEGTGIGLVITKHLTELMGGNIGVESVVGKGSRFWIELALFDEK